MHQIARFFRSIGDILAPIAHAIHVIAMHFIIILMQYSHKRTFSMLMLAYNEDRQEHIATIRDCRQIAEYQHESVDAR